MNRLGRKLLTVFLAVSMTVQPLSASVSAAAFPVKSSMNADGLQNAESAFEKEAESVGKWVKMPDPEPTANDVESVELDYPKEIDQSEFEYAARTGGSIPIPGDYYTSVVDDSLTPDLIDQLQSGDISPETLEADEESINAEGETVPSAYPSNYYNETAIKERLAEALPATRNQNDYGSCWAHSAVGAAEAYMINKQSAVPGSTDYSERHLAYYTYGDDLTAQNESIEENNPTGDSQTYNGYYYDSEGKEKALLDKGGNVWYAFLNLTRWRGLAKESTAKYPANGSEALSSVDWGHDVEYDSAARLKDVYSINITGNPSLLKKYVMDYGGVTVSFHAPDTKVGERESDYYNSSHNSYYYTGTATSTNHAVMIVGWDDSFPRSYFNTYPSADGAWLIRNSYKVVTGTPEMSYDTYFWLSYEDPLLKNGVAHAVKVMDKNEYSDNNYHYNDVLHNSSWYTGSSISAVNCYTLSGGADKELLTEISFQVVTFSENGEHPCTIRIYRNLDDTGDPSSGELIHEQEATLETGGYFTIPLSRRIVLDKNERFAVEVVIDNGSRTVDFETPYKLGDNTSEVSCADRGQSYKRLSYSAYSSYTDMYDLGNGNFCINAHTISMSSIVSSSLSSDGKDITIKWSSVPGATYVLAKSKSSSSGYVIVSEGTETQFTDTVENIGGYYYALRRKIGGSIIENTMSAPVYIAEDGNTPTRHLYTSDFNVDTTNAQGEYSEEAGSVSVTGPADYRGMVTVSYQKIADSEGNTLTDQAISTTPPVDAGTYRVYLNAAGAGDYFPAESLSDEAWVFTISPLEFDEEEVTVDGVLNEVYDGQSRFNNIEIYYGNTLLTYKKDYDILYYRHTQDENDRTLIDAGTVRFRYVGIGNYTGFVEFDHEIKPAVIYVTPEDGASKTEGIDDADIRYTADYSNVVKTELPLLNGNLSWNGAGSENGDKPGYYDITIGTLAPADNPASTSGAEDDFIASNYTLKLVGEKKLRIYESVKAEYIIFEENAIEYNGKEQSPKFSVWSGNTQLTENVDYEAAVTSAVNVGEEGLVSIHGIGEYRGNANKVFKIEPISLSDNDITVAGLSANEVYTYDGQEKKPEVTVSHNGVELTTADYLLSYEDNIHAGKGTARAVVIGRGNYRGTVKAGFDIQKRTLNVHANEIEKKKGLDDPGLTFTYDGQIAGDKPAFTGSLARQEGETIGSYLITIGTLKLKDGDEFLASDYDISFEENVFSIKRQVNRTLVVYDEEGERTSEITISDGDTLASLDKPQKEGYVFMGWYADPEFSKEYDLSEPIRENTELYPLLVDEATLDDHTETIVKNEKQATCTQDGYTGDVCCVKCDKVITPGQKIPATGHTTQIIGAKAATCQAAGYTGDTCCSVCGARLSFGSIIPPTGNHIWDAGTVAVQPAESSAGSMVYTCTVCGQKKTEPIPALGQTSSSAQQNSNAGNRILSFSPAKNKYTVKKGKNVTVKFFITPEYGNKVPTDVITAKIKGGASKGAKITKNSLSKNVLTVRVKTNKKKKGTIVLTVTTGKVSKSVRIRVK